MGRLAGGEAGAAQVLGRLGYGSAVPAPKHVGHVVVAGETLEASPTWDLASPTFNMADADYTYDDEGYVITRTKKLVSVEVYDFFG